MFLIKKSVYSNISKLLDWVILQLKWTDDTSRQKTSKSFFAKVCLIPANYQLKEIDRLSIAQKQSLWWHNSYRCVSTSLPKYNLAYIHVYSCIFDFLCIFPCCIVTPYFQGCCNNPTRPQICMFRIKWCTIMHNMYIMGGLLKLISRILLIIIVCSFCLSQINGWVGRWLLVWRIAWLIDEYRITCIPREREPTFVYSEQHYAHSNTFLTKARRMTITPLCLMLCQHVEYL